MELRERVARALAACEIAKMTGPSEEYRKLYVEKSWVHYRNPADFVLSAIMDGTDGERAQLAQQLLSACAPVDEGALADELDEIEREDEYVIWSNEHEAWWRPNNWGYTSKIEHAGVYIREEAMAIVDRATRSQWRQPESPNELPIRVIDLPKEARTLLLGMRPAAAPLVKKES